MRVTFKNDFDRFVKGRTYELDDLAAKVLVGKGVAAAGELDKKTVDALGKAFADSEPQNKEVKAKRVRKKSPHDEAFENGDPVDGEITD